MMPEKWAFSWWDLCCGEEIREFGVMTLLFSEEHTPRFGCRFACNHKKPRVWKFSRWKLDKMDSKTHVLSLSSRNWGQTGGSSHINIMPCKRKHRRLNCTKNYEKALVNSAEENRLDNYGTSFWFNNCHHVVSTIFLKIRKIFMKEKHRTTEDLQDATTPSYRSTRNATKIVAKKSTGKRLQI
ncbi:hypothetical protein ABZP36_014001 [Zizania latifolia]